jgi:hypothetical protein
MGRLVKKDGRFDDGQYMVELGHSMHAAYCPHL